MTVVSHNNRKRQSSPVWANRNNGHGIQSKKSSSRATAKYWQRQYYCLFVIQALQNYFPSL